MFCSDHILCLQHCHHHPFYLIQQQQQQKVGSENIFLQIPTPAMIQAAAGNVELMRSTPCSEWACGQLLCLSAHISSLLLTF